MKAHAQAGFEIRFDWGAGGLADIAQDVAAVVVVDVLSFTSAVDVACSRGASIYPSQWKDERAQAMAARLGATLAVSRDRVPAGGRYSLSPGTFRSIAEGVKVVLPSPNGAHVSLRAADAGLPVYAACLRNRQAAALALTGLHPLAVIAAGERRADGSLRPAWEDLIGCGALVHALPGSRSPESAVAAAAWNDVNDLAGQIANCASGRELREAGYGEDVHLAAEMDVSVAVPRLVNGAYVQVREWRRNSRP